MAKFLTTTGISAELERIIKDANDRLVLVSPFLKINENLKLLLADKNNFKIDIRVIYGKNELQPAETKWLRSMTSIKTSYFKNLHAKCYMNESSAIITSMNLYEFSQVNNAEMGILVRKDEDPSLFNEISDEVRHLIRNSDDITFEVEIVTPEAKSRKEKRTGPVSQPSRTKKSSTLQGHCLRCGSQIPFSVVRPLCEKDYRSWARYENNEFVENHCHSCGNEHVTTYAKPLCRTCWTKHHKAGII